MRIEVRALARHCCLELGAVHSPGQQPQRGLDAERHAIPEQRLIIPRALDGEQPREDVQPRERRDTRRASHGRSGDHRTIRMRSPTPSPAAKYDRAPRAEWKIVHAAAPATDAATPTTNPRERGSLSDHTPSVATATG